MKNPEILTLNLRPEVVEHLRKNNYNFFEGSLGKIMEGKNGNNHFFSPNHKFPENIQEYDIIIIDLDYVEKTEYAIDEDVKIWFSYENFEKEYDTRNISTYILYDELLVQNTYEIIWIIFQTKSEENHYNVHQENHPTSFLDIDIYNKLPIGTAPTNKTGNSTNIIVEDEILRIFLNKYNDEFSYKTTFEKKKYITPLVNNKTGDMISFHTKYDKADIYVFPQMQDYSGFLIDFLENVLPQYYPAKFPTSAQLGWITKEEYYLPNQVKLLKERKELEEEWKKKDERKQKEIDENYQNLKFLHDILVCDSGELVQAVIKYLKWLEFENVVDMDVENPLQRDEDIQIENEKGLLIIEVKGIGGTSKDEECSQISKHRFDRSEEKGHHKIFCLYIVNHQRHKEPLQRQLKPFSEKQIQLAVNEKRGLLTTFQLFKLYFDVEKGLLSKEEARNYLYEKGFIEFKPTNLMFVGTVTEIFKNNASILLIDDIMLSINQEIYVEKNEIYELNKVLEIRLDDKTVESTSKGENGIRTEQKIAKGSKIWLKRPKNINLQFTV